MPNRSYVYDFDHVHERSPRELAELLGGKGANLAEMTSVLQLPVPPGFTISTEACRAYLRDGWPEGLAAEVAAAVSRLELRSRRRVEDPTEPLLLSVRSGARFSMPGMMDTVLNVGLNDRSVEALARRTERRFALDSYRRLIAQYARVVLDVPGEAFEALLDDAKRQAGVTTDAALGADALAAVVAASLRTVQQHTGAAFPQEPALQLRGAIEAVFRSWGSPRAITYRTRERIAAELGTAVNVQVMVFGNRDARSATGVGFTRNPVTGSAEPYGDFLVNAQGEDVVPGIRRPEPLASMQAAFPAAYDELLGIFARLERHYRELLDTEFTIEQDKLWMLQVRVGKRTGAAALRLAVAMVEDPAIALDRREALQRVRPEHLEQVLHPTFSAAGTVIATGLAASPGAAVGRVCLSADAAVDAAEQGHDVILVRTETSPEDVHGMQVARGVLTVRGGLVSHAAVVARGWGIPAVVGAEGIEIVEGGFTATSAEGVTVSVSEGTVISIDGNSGAVMLDALATVEGAPPPEFDVVLGWADEVCQGLLEVRANADTGPDAVRARAFGARGVGLCRTEHQFLGDRLPLLRRAILATTDEEEATALAQLADVQRADFEALLGAMDGLPVTVRLLDPPLHEFLPSLEDIAGQEATGQPLSDEQRALHAATRHWHEQNPMLGTRGVRLGILRPGLYRMQVAALLDAVAARLGAGGRPMAEIMIPLVVGREELALVRGWVQDEIDAATRRHGRDLAAGGTVAIGTMIETPRAALGAADIAEVADFFSFGTNDLTQMTFGFSRDDVESRILPTYLAAGLLAHNPFETIDVDGVGELVSLGVARGRTGRADLAIGVCGEHGGDPASIAFFLGAGVDYVSCSPFRVPVARLAAAHAVLTRGQADLAPADR